MKWEKIIYPGLAVAFTAILFWAWGIVRGVPTILTPGGAVVAFELSQCPSGWTDFELAKGRFVVGVGQGNNLTERTLLENGGTESHTLTVSELPPHRHPGNVSYSGASAENFQTNSNYPLASWESQSGETGGGLPHNNMPPFVALRYCRKN